MARYVSVSDYLEYSSPANLESAASIFIRLKPSWSSGDSTQHYLWSYGTSGDPECAIQRYSDNNIYAGWYAGGGRIVISDAGLFSSGTWVNILLDYDDAANTQNLYFNNTLAGSLSDAFAVQTSLGKLRIGLGTQGSRPTDADVAEFARWDHVLDSTERATLQSTGNPSCLSTGLVHHYKILGNDSPEPDEVGSEDLTLVGSPAQATHPTVGSCGSTYTLTADGGAFTLTGQSATLKADRKLTAAAGTFTLTGIDAALKVARKLVADVGAYTLTGIDAGLNKGYTMAAAVGEFALTGIDASLKAARKLTAETGTYTLTGIDAALKAARKLTADVGSFTLTGLDAALRFGYGFIAGVGSFALTGIDAGLKAARTMTADLGTYILTGIDALLSVSLIRAPGVRLTLSDSPVLTMTITNAAVLTVTVSDSLAIGEVT